MGPGSTRRRFIRRAGWGSLSFTWVSGEVGTGKGEVKGLRNAKIFPRDVSMRVVIKTNIEASEKLCTCVTFCFCLPGTETTYVP